MSRVIGLRDALGHRAVPADDAAGQRGCTGRGYAVEGAVGLFAGYAEPQQDDEASYGAGNGRGGEDRNGDHLSSSLVNALIGGCAVGRGARDVSRRLDYS